MAYDRRYYASIREGCQSSARAVVPRLIEVFDPRSVVDIGCGEGWWLKEFVSRKPRIDMLGIDQPGLDGNCHVAFRGANLDDPLAIGCHFDLALCLEVAEHLKADRAVSFVRDLCSLSDIVVFSAAVPGQGGADHQNERWQSWWVKEFRSAWYDCADFLRWEFWNDRHVESWYRQNLLVFYNQRPSRAMAWLAEYSKPFQGDVIHPDFYKQLLTDWKLASDRCQGTACREWYASNWGTR